MVTARQFDVCRVVGLRSGSAVDLAVVVQDETLSHLSTRVVAPLIPVDNDFVVERATPVAEIDGVRYLMATYLMTTIPLRNLGNIVASFKDREREIKNAIDLVFFGV